MVSYGHLTVNVSLSILTGDTDDIRSNPITCNGHKAYGQLAESIIADKVT